VEEDEDKEDEEEKRDKFDDSGDVPRARADSIKWRRARARSRPRPGVTNYSSDSELGSVLAYRSFAYASDSDDDFVKMGYQRTQPRSKRLTSARRRNMTLSQQTLQLQQQHEDAQPHDSYGSMAPACPNPAFISDPATSESFRHGAMTSEGAGDLLLASEAMERVCQQDPAAAHTIYAAIAHHECGVMATLHDDVMDEAVPAGGAGVMFPSREPFEGLVWSSTAQNVPSDNPYVTMTSQSKNSYETMTFDPAHSALPSAIPEWEESGDGLHGDNESHVYESVLMPGAPRTSCSQRDQSCACVSR
jgi:hypothetical protein